jgi:hypothetical protein
MLETIFWILVGAFIGWNLPQPAWAKSVQDAYIAPVLVKIKGFFFTSMTK